MKKHIVSAMIICSINTTALLTTTACGKKESKEEIEKPTAELETELQEEAATTKNEIKDPVSTPEPSQEPVPEATQELELCQVVHCNEYITLREQPSTSGTEICKIPLGSDVYYIENAENGFVKIRYNDQEGYSLASYLNFTKEDVAIFMKVYNCNERITLRKIPSTKAEEFCQIPLGEKVIFREAAENDFYMISYDGYTGYALSEYLIEW